MHMNIDSYVERLGRISNVRNPLSCFEPTRGSEKNYGIIRGFGVCTSQGLVRNYNEDRVSIVLNIARPQNFSKSEYWPQCSFFGVYDGHGGIKCAEFLRNKLHHYVLFNVGTVFLELSSIVNTKSTFPLASPGGNQ